MILIELVFAIALGIFVVLLLVNSMQRDQQQQRLRNAFYKQLEAENGYISLIQLVAAAQVDPGLAQQFLERQAQLLTATPEVDADGDTFYRFPKLRPSDVAR
ncbi:MAG: hypothetical protein KME12_20175 [Trichocoleus desertorum ATA4-8-CV12]|jgi:type II secretory pathway pseudopilin PulG|nr:hypothetical protein [Trichocoleus desertorum ATA4-8-CV12]